MMDFIFWVVFGVCIMIWVLLLFAWIVYFFGYIFRKGWDDAGRGV